jgi:First Longin domain of FUZ, MON1 and HPS1
MFPTTVAHPLLEAPSAGSFGRRTSMMSQSQHAVTELGNHSNPVTRCTISSASAAGKPVFTRYGDEGALAGFTALLQALAAFAADRGDSIQSIRFEGCHHHVPNRSEYANGCVIPAQCIAAV